MSKRVKSAFNPITGEAVVRITDPKVRSFYNKRKAEVFVGKAKVNECDKDVMSKTTGMSIAYMRAEIKRFDRKIRDCERRAKDFEKKAAHERTIKETHVEILTDLKEGLEKYLKDKETFAKNFRKNKAKQKSK